MNGQAHIWSGLLLLIFGAWLVFQTLGGDLPRRIISAGAAVAERAG